MALVKFKNGYDKGLSHPYSELFNSFFNPEPAFAGGSVKLPSVNISETEAAFLLEFAAPGMKKESFKINVDDNKLTVIAEHKNEQSDEKKFTRREFSYSSFQRSFNLPEAVDQNKISATYVDGILAVTLAKKEESKPAVKEIEVK